MMLVAIPLAAGAAPFTYDDALERALGTAPATRAEALGIEAARSGAKSADALPDPKLTLGLDNFPVSGPPAGSFSRENMAMGRIGLMQDIPNAAKRRARLGRAQADIGRAEAEQRIEARSVRLGTALAWIDLAFAELRLRTINDIIEEWRPLVASAPSSVASGSARPAETLDVQRSQAVLADRRSEIVAEIARARAELARWTGDPSPAILGDPPNFIVDPDTLRSGLERHPKLLALAASFIEAEAEVDLARADKRPDWSVELAYQRRHPDFGDMVSIGVAIDLPLFPSQRQEPRIAAKVAEAGRVSALRGAARRELAAELEAALADHAMRREQWVRARRTLLPLAERQVKLEIASYAARAASLLDVLRAYGTLAEARLTTLDRELALVRAAALLELSYGGAE